MIGVRSGRLSPLGTGPHGVSSQAAHADRRVEALYFSGDSKESWDILESLVAELPRTRLIKKDHSYMHWVCRSLVWGFIDDLEFLVDAGGSRIEVRSAARMGYWDMNVNARRIEAIRTRYYSILHGERAPFQES